MISRIINFTNVSGSFFLFVIINPYNFSISMLFSVTVVGESGGSDDECETLIDKPNRSDVNTPFEKSSFLAEEGK